MKVVIAPDSFKECLPAAEVAAALARGVLKVVPDAQIDLCPMADGGEGTVAAMVAATGGEFRTADVFGPLGEPVRARFGLLGRHFGAVLPGELGVSAAVDMAEGAGGGDSSDARTAVVEMAAASGLGLVPPGRRDPRRTTTFGTGQLIMAALDAGAREIIIGIGGSATCDGGCGCAQAIGVVFTDAKARPCVCGLAGGGLADIEGIDGTDRDPRIAETRIRVACDVTNPLTGPEGAAAVYGPQKGATPEMVEQLDAGLAHLADLVRRELGADVEKIPGAGASGGLGAGLVAFAGASLESGVNIIAEAVELPRRLTGADLCITGEGKLDRQSLAGKTAIGVSRMANAAGVPVICVPGQAAPDAPYRAFAGVRPLVEADVTPQAAMRQTEALLQRRAAEALEGFAPPGDT